MDTTYPVVITVDGDTYNFTQDSLAEYIKHAEARKQVATVANDAAFNTLKQMENIRKTVYSFFKNYHTTGDTKLEFEVSAINELLDEIGTEKLQNLYKATVIITIEVDNIEATDKDEVKQIIDDELVVEINTFDIDIQQIDIDEIEEY